MKKPKAGQGPPPAEGADGPQRPPPAPHNVGEVIELGMGDNLFEHVFDERMNLRDDKVIVIFTNSTCLECKKAANEFAKLAQALQD